MATGLFIPKRFQGDGVGLRLGPRRCPRQQTHMVMEDERRAPGPASQRPATTGATSDGISVLRPAATTGM